MKNQTLKPGDLVRYKTQNPNLDNLGFTLNETYFVKRGSSKHTLRVTNNLNSIQLVDTQNNLTEYTDYFTTTKTPKLSKGLI